jgi:hypothetical protein
MQPIWSNGRGDEMAARKHKNEHSPSSTASEPQPATVADDEIARRAYDLFLSRGGEHGHHVEDWLQAERELKGAALSDAA